MIKQAEAWLVWFYCLKISDAVMILTACTILFCVVDKYLKDYKWWRWLCTGFLAASLAAAFLVTIGNRGGGSDYQINLVPFHTYREVMNGGHPDIYRTNFMNAALFYPAGLLLTSLLPQKWPGWCRCLLTAVLFGAMSGAIEYVQYHYALGNVEIDDVIHNTGGALAGSLAMLVLTPMINRIAKNVAAWLKNE